ncbi:putative polyprotein, partial [Gregarina niphandrodes]
LARWRSRLCEFDIQLQHVAGKDNGLADWLSRLPEDHDVTAGEISVPIVLCVGEAPPALSIALLKAQSPPDFVRGKLTCVDGFWLHALTRRLYIPDKLRSVFLRMLHGAPATGHAGYNRCLARACRYVWWPTLEEDLKRHIDRCRL